MGATNNIARITANTSGIGDVYFAAIEIDGHRISERTQAILQELDAPGVDGLRFRKRNEKYKSFKMRTIADGPSRTAGELEANMYEDLSGEYVTLTVTIASTTRTWKNVKVLDKVEMQLMPGLLAGGSADPASAYVLYGEWTLILSEPSSS